MNNELHARLKHCLSTILEMENEIREERQREALSDEFSQIRGFLERADELSLEEDVVGRMEALTASFLSEMCFVERVSEHSLSNRVVQ